MGVGLPSGIGTQNFRQGLRRIIRFWDRQGCNAGSRINGKTHHRQAIDPGQYRGGQTTISRGGFGREGA